MARPKDIIVLTTSTADGIKVKKYLKPVSAHVVAGTNIFSDFFASLSDIFGGRSGTYQKQLASLYDEAIDRVKYTAHEIGGNCILGLSIDMDEISGKGKSMFMITAVGTAVVIEIEPEDSVSNRIGDKPQHVSVERIDILRREKSIIERAKEERLILNDDVWEFITTYQIEEVFPYILKKFQETITKEIHHPGSTEKYNQRIIKYLNALPEDIKIEFLYHALTVESDDIAGKLTEIIKQFDLFDCVQILKLLRHSDFRIQKRGVRIATFDKAFYDKQDILDLQEIIDFIEEEFKERGTRTTKKQLLSSKEREIWMCECGKNNEEEIFCGRCGQDIYGFRQSETKPKTAISHLKEKIELIQECL